MMITLKNITFALLFTTPQVGCAEHDSNKTNEYIYEGLELLNADKQGCRNYGKISIKDVLVDDGMTLSIYTNAQCNGLPSRTLSFEDAATFAGIWDDFIVVDTSITVNQHYFKLISNTDNSVEYEFRFEGDGPQFTSTHISFYSPSDAAVNAETCHRDFGEDVEVTFKTMPDHFQMAKKQVFDVKTRKTVTHADDMICIYLQ